MMRSLALLVVTTSVATNSGAQTPLTVDTNFRFYYTPELMDYWDSTLINSWAEGWQPFVSDITLRQNGQVLITGSRIMPVNDLPVGNNRSMYIAPDGSPDGYLTTSFAAGPFQEIPSTNQYFSGNSRRWNYDSSWDPTFSMADFYVNMRYAGSWQIFEDRSGLVAGYFRITQEDPLRYVLVKVDQWGAWDSTYTPRHATGQGGSVSGRLLFPIQNGQYLFNGSWTHYEGRPSGSMIRINEDGSQDTTFYFPSWKSDVRAFHEQADGKVILGGQFWMNAYSDTLHLVRLNLDGSLDLTFNNFTDYRTGTSMFSSMIAGINVLERLDADRLVVGGAFTLVDGNPRGSIACVDTLGNLLDCWAGGGLQPVSYSQSGFPHVSLAGFKRLANGETYIYGKYQGFGDANGMHPEQVLISKIYMPDVGMNESAVPPNTLRVWPNPGVDAIQLAWGTNSPYTLELCDAQGRFVLAQPFVFNNSLVDVSAVASGFYTLQVRTSAGERAFVKWMKP